MGLQAGRDGSWTLLGRDLGQLGDNRFNRAPPAVDDPDPIGVRYIRGHADIRVVVVLFGIARVHAYGVSLVYFRKSLEPEDDVAAVPTQGHVGRRAAGWAVPLGLSQERVDIVGEVDVAVAHRVIERLSRKVA